MVTGEDSKRHQHAVATDLGRSGSEQHLHRAAVQVAVHHHVVLTNNSTTDSDETITDEEAETTTRNKIRREAETETETETETRRLLDNQTRRTAETATAAHLCRVVRPEHVVLLDVQHRGLREQRADDVQHAQHEVAARVHDWGR